MQPRALSIGGMSRPADNPPVIQPIVTQVVTQAVPVVPPLKMEEIATLGNNAQAAVSTITTKMTGIARTGDIDELGTALNQLVSSAKGYDPSNMKGLFGMIRKKVHEIKDHYATVDGQVTNLLREVDKRVALFRSRVGELDSLYEANQQYETELKAAAATLQQKIDVMQANPPAVDAGDTASAQRYADWQTILSMATKRVDDLQRAALLAEQQGPQIRLMAQNSIALAQAFDDVKLTTIPALKQQFTLYLLNLEQEKGADLHKSIVETTNETIRKNAEKLGQATVKVQTAAATPTISLDTLKTVQTNLLNSLSEVQRIRTEMHQRITTEQPQLLQLSQELSKTLAQGAK